MTRRWVVNSSPLIGLAKISQIHLLIQLCSELVIPSGVLQEINCGEDYVRCNFIGKTGGNRTSRLTAV